MVEFVIITCGVPRPFTKYISKFNINNLLTLVDSPQKGMGRPNLNIQRGV